MDLEDSSISHLHRLLESNKREYLDQGDAIDQAASILTDHPENLETAVIIYEEENKRITQPVFAIGIAVKDENKNPCLIYTEKHKEEDANPYKHIQKLPLENLLSYTAYIPITSSHNLKKNDSKKEISQTLQPR